VAEVVQAARRVEPAALVQVLLGELRARGTFSPAGVEDRYLAERVMYLTFTHLT
jgi:hypothetical protein